VKEAEVPKGLLIGIVAVLVLVIGYFAYTTFMKGPAQADPAKIPADRLLDPDRRGQ
jgi:uncharacterized membrane protein YukC